MRRSVAALGFVALSCTTRREPDVELNADPYGPCFDAQGFTICREDEPVCDAYPDLALAELTVCAAACELPADCPASAGGDPEIVCAGDPPACSLSCAGGQACPDGMECAPTGACMWTSG